MTMFSSCQSLSVGTDDAIVINICLILELEALVLEGKVGGGGGHFFGHLIHKGI